MSAITKCHIALYPWFALGHITPFLNLSNKLAKIGHKISFLIPTRTLKKLEALNLHPQLITFFPISLPHIEGLPLDAETTSDVPFSLYPLLMSAMDLTANIVETILQKEKVDVVLYDFAFWVPNLARRIGIKSVHYNTISPLTLGYIFSPARRLQGKLMTEDDLMKAPPGFPASDIKLHLHEARDLVLRTNMKSGSNVSFFKRLYTSLIQCDAQAHGTCWELEGQICIYLSVQFGKPMLLSGPTISISTSSTLEEKWLKWLNKFKESSVIYCAFGSECTLEKNQFKELLLGLELTGRPFLAVLKPPLGCKTIEEAISLEFEFNNTLQERGVVYNGWVQQRLILQHPSVGCFVTHCGWNSTSEAMVNNCQMVLLPHGGDQIINARILSMYMRVGVEVEKGEEDGLFTREYVCKAVELVMDEKNNIAKEISKNHKKIREFLLTKEHESNYISSFSQELENLITS